MHDIVQDTHVPGRSPGGRPNRLAVLILLVFSWVWFGLAQPAAAQTYSFGSVSVEGNDRIEAATILNYAGIARGQSVTAAGLNDAYQRIIGSGLFEAVELSPQGNTLVIRVTELSTINVVNFEGNRRIDDAELTALVKSQSRRVFSPAQADADVAAIIELYRARARFAASVDARIIRRDDRTVDLVFEIREGRVVEIERLSFVGNRAFSDRRLRQVLETKQAGFLRRFIQRDTFVPERIEFDKRVLTDFYKSRGFADFEVLSATTEVARERNAFFTTFTVREGQRFTFGAISAVSEYEGADAAEYQAVIRLRPGVVYSPSLVEETIARMESLAVRQGLQFARIEPRVTRNERNQTLDVAFAIVRGPRVFVERIDIEGNATTLDQVIRRQFRTVEGDPFNPREIRNAAERIRALGFFTDSQVETTEGSSAEQVVVDVNVEEQPTGSLSFGVSYGVSSGVGFAIGFSETNFLGRGQQVSFSVDTTSDSADTSFTFVEPAFLDRDLRFRFRANYTETNSDNADYDTRSIGLSPSIEFPISERARLELRYRISEDTLSGLDTTQSSAILLAEQGGFISSVIGYTVSYDTRINGFNPNTGVLLSFNQDFAGIGGDVEYVSTSVQMTAQTKVLNEEVTLRADLSGGGVAMISGNSRVTDRLFLGGRLRGFEPKGIGPRDLNVPNQDALGGNLFALARFEAEFPLGLPEEYGITGGLFLDVGSVWSLDNVNGGLDGLSPVDDSANLRSAIGFSVFWTTPIGPLRFNFSRALVKEDYDQEQNFDLTVSTRF